MEPYAYPLLIKQLLVTPIAQRSRKEIVYRDRLRMDYPTLLERISRLGSARPELSADAHVIFYKSHAILYRIDDADVFVRRIRQGHEDWMSDPVGDEP